MPVCVTLQIYIEHTTIRARAAKTTLTQPYAIVVLTLFLVLFEKDITRTLPERHPLPTLADLLWF